MHGWSAALLPPLDSDSLLGPALNSQQDPAKAAPAPAALSRSSELSVGPSRLDLMVLGVLSNHDSMIKELSIPRTPEVLKDSSGLGQPQLVHQPGDAPGCCHCSMKTSQPLAPAELTPLGGSAPLLSCPKRLW